MPRCSSGTDHPEDSNLVASQKDSIEIDQAVVRWTEQGEFGVQIVSLSNNADSRLAAHIEQLLRQGTVGESAEVVLCQATMLLKGCV